MTVTPAEVIERLVARGQTVATAESLTGGLVVAALVDVPGASRVVRGGLVVYATDLKQSLAGVDALLLAERGPVDPDVAAALAHGAQARCGADWGVATTGVAGPDPQNGVEPGTVLVAVAGPAGSRVRRQYLPGARSRVRAETVTAALDLLGAILGEA